MNSSSLLRTLPFLLLAVASAVACSRSDDGTKQPSAAAGAVDPKPLPPYEVRPIASAGTVSGTIEIEGDAPRDSVVRPAVDPNVCGASFTDETIAARNGRLAGAVVWIEDLREGRDLPRERRYEATIDRCRVRPRVQIAHTGGTLNLLSRDHVAHDIAVRRGGDTLVHFRPSAEGQMVPLDRPLAAPGHLELRCGIHPWMRADVLVFDHPYVAASGADGAFTIDSVPPGTHRVVAWHERFGRFEGTVDVAAGGTGRLVLKARAQ